MSEENIPREKVYRGPPPRKDLVISPLKEKNWKGHELFKETPKKEVINRENTENTTEIGITPGLVNGHDEDIRPISRGREYDSEFAKLSLQGGHKDLILTGGDEDFTERRHKKCENLSEFNRISKQGGHKDILRSDVESVDQLESGRRQKACDTEKLSSYNQLAKTGGHKDAFL